MPSLNRRQLLYSAAAISSSFFFFRNPGIVNARKTFSSQPEDQQIKRILNKIVADQPIPGIIAAIAEQGKDLKIACAGKRKKGEEPSVEVDDLMHMGSCTKAMTATLIGRLVDKKKLKFSHTINELLPSLAAKIHADYRDVTIANLLTHRSGMPANAKNWWLSEGTTISQKRFNIAVDTLDAAPAERPNSSYTYSNLGYMVAGMMAAAVGKKSWEEMIAAEVFQPLRMDSAGFGVPGTSGKIDQPWGHISLENGKARAIQGDNAPALGPAGTIHMTVADWAKFALLHSVPQKELETMAKSGKQAGKSRVGGLLTPETMLKLHSPVKPLTSSEPSYAMGWITGQRSWAGGEILTHSGTNTMWYCTVWLAPIENRAYLVAANIAGGQTGAIIDSVFGPLIQVAKR